MCTGTVHDCACGRHTIFPPEMLDAIANSDVMQAMHDEFKNLQKKHKLTKIWADPLRKHFDTMYEEAIHRRHLTTTLVTQPLSHDKAINKITQTNKQNNKTKHEASVRDFDHSRKRLRGVKRKQQRDRPTTVA